MGEDVEMKIIRRLKLWFCTRKEIIDEIQKLSEMLDIRMEKIEELDQNKIYAVHIDQSNLKHITECFDIISKKMRWTAPNIIFTTHKITELDQKELTIIAKQLGDQGIQIRNKS